MDCLGEWIGSLAEQAMRKVIECGIENTELILGRKGRVTFEADGSNTRAVVHAERIVQVIKVSKLLRSKTFRILLMRFRAGSGRASTLLKLGYPTAVPESTL